MTAPVLSVIDVRARMFPEKFAPVPIVAELPTCQKILQAFAPLSRETLLLLAAPNVEPVWKIHTALGSPRASSVTVPVIPNEEGLL